VACNLQAENNKIKLLMEYASVTQNVLLSAEGTTLQTVVYGISSCK
jgi:hypothetical protein